MLRKNTTVVLIVFAVLAIFTVYWQQTRAVQDGPEVEGDFPTPVPTQATLFDFGVEDVARLEIRAAGGEGIVLLLGEDETWVMEEPEDAIGELDQSAIPFILEQLVTWRPQQELAGLDDIGAIGLSDPTYTITIDLNNGEQVVIKVGIATITGTGYYIQVDDNDPQIVRSFLVDGMTALIEQPPTLPVLETPTPEDGEDGEDADATAEPDDAEETETPEEDAGDPTETPTEDSGDSVTEEPTEEVEPTPTP